MAARLELEVNQLVEIQIKGQKEKYKSRVEEINLRNIVVGAPMSEGLVIPVALGAEISVFWLTPTALFSFNSVVRDRKNDSVQLLILDHPETVKRTQRRNFVRMASQVPINFSILSEDFSASFTRNEAITKDISGGGIMFINSFPIEIGSQLDLEMELPNGLVNLVGKVVRCLPVNNDKAYNIGIDFSIIPEKERDRIIKYVFDLQRELRAKGLL